MFASRIRVSAGLFAWATIGLAVGTLAGCGGEEQLDAPQVIVEGPAGQSVQLEVFHFGDQGQRGERRQHTLTLTAEGRAELALADHGTGVLVRFKTPNAAPWVLRLVDEGKTLGEQRSGEAGTELIVSFGEVPPPPYGPQDGVPPEPETPADAR